MKLNDERDFKSLIDWARQGTHSPDEISQLATYLANSGEKLEWAKEMKIADLASTGGPGSLSTLLSPIALMSQGYKVVKLAVPGRPAGAIDTLGTIPGYRVILSTKNIRSIVTKTGFAHFLTDDRFAPIDGKLYAYRRQINAVAIPMLAAASLLAKKLAAGVRIVGLDARIGSHGNFGATSNEARENAINFCVAAKQLDIDAVVFIKNDCGPAQPWIGRGENLVALAHAVGVYELADSDSWLDRHVADCCEMARITVGGRQATQAVASKTIGWNLTDNLRYALEQHLEAQGSSMKYFLGRVFEIMDSSRLTIFSEKSGILTVNLDILRNVLVSAQTQELNTIFGDQAGVLLLIKPGTLIYKGQPIAIVRHSGTSSYGKLLVNRLAQAFRVVSAEPDPSSIENQDLEIIRFKDNEITSEVVYV
ncbi:MAG: hypothetical protein C4548_02675 [Desulfobacteraceae bacterium]|nr:MAG: hypothetical protein C4548_02675 [Desulfobacteraceae bacterium]